MERLNNLESKLEQCKIDIRSLMGDLAGTDYIEDLNDMLKHLNRASDNLKNIRLHNEKEEVIRAFSEILIGEDRPKAKQNKYIVHYVINKGLVMAKGSVAFDDILTEDNVDYVRREIARQTGLSEANIIICGATPIR